jgi:hypothetical protein
MTEFRCPERRAKATLRFPLLFIEYENKRITPKVQDHDVFRVTLYRNYYGCGNELRGSAMPDIAGFLSTLDQALIKSKEWDYNHLNLTMEFTEPVTVGEHAKIKKLAMTYYPWWSKTEAMIAAHKAWRIRVGME